MYLRKRGKKWYYTIEVPTEDGQGRLREERVGGTSYAQAAKAYRQAMKALDEAAVSEKPVIKMMDFLLEWLEKDVRINLGPNTYDSYAGIIKWHIGARFGNEALDALTTAEIQDWINSLKQDGYSRSTVKSIFTVFNDAMRWAVSNRQYIETNPMANVKMPKFDIPRKKPVIFSHQQIQIIFHAFPLGHKYYAPCMIAYCTGLRVGECLALQWSHIDMENRTLIVPYMIKKASLSARRRPRPSHRSGRFPLMRLYTKPWSAIRPSRPRTTVSTVTITSKAILSVPAKTAVR